MVKIVEFTQPEKRLPFDVVDDVCVFMRNDPIFYRKQLFPAIMRIKDLHDTGKPINTEACLGEVCNRAMESYCKKYKLGTPSKFFKDEDKNLIMDKLYSEELHQIKNGAY